MDPQAFPFAPWRDYERIVSWIVELTGATDAEVRRRLREEFDTPGTAVTKAFYQAGLEPFTWSDGLAKFYEQTDSFLYELIIWNCNALKGKMRRAAAAQLARGQDGPLDILMIGDGLGFDSAHLALAGHHVTYFELPGYAESFARQVFTAGEVKVNILNRIEQIPLAGFDAVVCLDVLEHVPDAPAMVKSIAGYLRPGGRFVVHAPFLFLHPRTLTHLRANRKYSGSLALYAREHLRLVDGAMAWNPITLQKPGGNAPVPSMFHPKLLALWLVGCVMMLGRYGFLPLAWVGVFVQRAGRWFEEPPTAAAHLAKQ